MDILYNPDWGTLDLKFWLMFAKKKFMNRVYYLQKGIDLMKNAKSN